MKMIIFYLFIALCASLPTNLGLDKMSKNIISAGRSVVEDLKPIPNQISSPNSVRKSLKLNPYALPFNPTRGNHQVLPTVPIARSVLPKNFIEDILLPILNPVNERKSTKLNPFALPFKPSRSIPSAPTQDLVVKSGSGSRNNMPARPALQSIQQSSIPLPIPQIKLKPRFQQFLTDTAGASYIPAPSPKDLIYNRHHYHPDPVVNGFQPSAVIVEEPVPVIDGVDPKKTYLSPRQFGYLIRGKKF